MQLNPGSCVAYSARAMVRWDFQWDWAGAESDLARAFALAPKDPHALRTRCILENRAGRLAASAAACKEAMEVDPLAVANWNLLTGTYLALGDLGLAKAAIARALELSPDSNAAGYNRCIVAVYGGDPAALEPCERLPDEDDRLYWTTLAKFAAGGVAAASKALPNLTAKLGGKHPDQLGDLYAWLGDTDRAFEWLERAYSQHVGLSDIKADPMLRKIRGDPRYAALLRKMNLPPD